MILSTFLGGFISLFIITTQLESGDTLKYYINPRLLTQDTSSLDTSSSDSGEMKIFPDLRISGNKGIFLSFNGNSGDLTQMLNISISGKLKDNMEIKGVLRDYSVPGDQDLYTEKLRDIDEVYLQIRKSRDLQVDLGRIHHHGRNLLGFRGAWRNLTAVYGIEKGKMHRISISIKPGVAGPYKIAEPYALVDGSVLVYVNGKEISKSQYEVNYSVGSLNFIRGYLPAPHDMVEVEFEEYGEIPGIYTDISFERNFYSIRYREFNEDVNSWLQNVDTVLLDTIKQLGDSAGEIYLNGAFMKDHGDYNFVDSFFVFAGYGKGEYAVHFTYMGPDSGSYVFDNLLGAYKYVGKGKGFYEPVIKFIPPQRLREFDFYISPQNFILDVRISDFDKNLISKIDDRDNIGASVRVSRLFTLGSGRLALAGYYISREYRNMLLAKDTLWREYHGKDNTIGGNLIFTLGTEEKKLRFSFSGRRKGVIKEYLSILNTKFKSLSNGVRLSKSGDSLSFEDILKIEIPISLNPGLSISYYRDDSSFYLVNFSVHRNGLKFSLNRFRSPANSKLWATFLLHDRSEFAQYRINTLGLYDRDSLEIIYRSSFGFNISKDTRLQVDIDRIPSFQILKEERYYPVNFGGSFFYDSLTGTFGEAECGSYIRDIVPLGVRSSIFRNIYHFEAEHSGGDVKGMFSYTRTKEPSQEGEFLYLEARFNKLNYFHTRNIYTDKSFVMNVERRYIEDWVYLDLGSFRPGYKRTYSKEEQFKYILNYPHLRFNTSSGFIEMGVWFTSWENNSVQSLSFKVNQKRTFKGMVSSLDAIFVYPLKSVEIPLYLPSAKSYGFKFRIEKKIKDKYSLEAGFTRYWGQRNLERGFMGINMGL